MQYEFALPLRYIECFEKEGMYYNDCVNRGKQRQNAVEIDSKKTINCELLIKIACNFLFPPVLMNTEAKCQTGYIGNRKTNEILQAVHGRSIFP